MTVNEFIVFVFDKEKSVGRKTQVWRVHAIRNLALLGTIKWLGRWRQYTFYPEGDTIFNAGCLREIADKAEELSKDHRAKERDG